MDEENICENMFLVPFLFKCVLVAEKSDQIKWFHRCTEFMSNPLVPYSVTKTTMTTTTNNNNATLCVFLDSVIF